MPVANEMTGVRPTTCFPVAMGEIHNDGTWKYFGEAMAGTALTTDKWRISRMNITTKQVQWCDGNANYDNVYTDYATVVNLSYS